MAKIHGKDGSITFAGGYTTSCKSWQVTRTLETGDTTPLGSANRMYGAGLKTASGSFVCFADGTTPLVDVGTTGNATFTMATGRTLTVAILITDFDVSVGLDGFIEVTYKWIISGTGIAGDFAIA